MSEMRPSKPILVERQNLSYRSPLINEYLPQVTPNRQAQWPKAALNTILYPEIEDWLFLDLIKRISIRCFI
jgi:hypothetical protein